MKKSVITGSIILLIGCLMFTVTMCVLNWDFTKLSNHPPFEEKTTVVENLNQAITVQCDNVAISVGKSADNNIHFIYSEREKECYEINQATDINIKKVYTYEWYEYLSIMDFNFEKPFTILLPDNYDGKLSFTTSNASIEIKDVSLQSLSAITSNGKVEFDNVNATDNLVVKTSNNDVIFDNIQTNERIDMTTSNGAIDLNNISAKSINAKSSNNKILAKDLDIIDDISLKTSNGKIDVDTISAKENIILETSNNKISGNISGKMSDYNITSKTSNAKNNLPEIMTDGSIGLNVSTSNGDIDIIFDNR